MAQTTIPTTQEIADANLSGFESKIAQSSPLNDAAFLRVLAVVEALALTGLYKLSVESTKQNLVLTASGANLDLLGAETTTPRKLAEYASLTVSLPATTDLTIPTTAAFTGDANGVRYVVTEAAVSVAGSALLSITADEPGVAGNLQAGDTLTIVSQVAGAGAQATVVSVVNTGTEDETDEDYRPRVQTAQRTPSGGGNLGDHKRWAESISGVKRAYPYAGRPLGTSYPGDRLIYIEAATVLDPDGLPPYGLLDEVRAAINIDPATGLSRPLMGRSDDTLWIEPISRVEFVVTITNLAAPPGTLATVRTSLEDALRLFLLDVRPYIEGVDVPEERNDRVTKMALSQVVQEVMRSTGSTAASVSFTVAGVAYDAYPLIPGKLAKLSSVVYATV